MPLIQLLLTVLFLATLFVGGYSSAAERDARTQLWIRRTVDTTVALARDPNQPEHAKEFSVGMASLALGRMGCASEALRLFDQAGFEGASKLRQQGLSALADGLSSGDHVEDALRVVETIENEYVHGSAFSLVAIRQAQRSDFEDAEALHSQIPSQTYRDRAARQICSEYAQVGKYDDARRLANAISDEDMRSEIVEEIDARSTQPLVTDEGYIDFQLEEARNRTFGVASNSQLKFLNHYYEAEVALAVNDQSLFDRVTRSARLLAEAMNDNDGALLMLGRLMYTADRKEDAKELYSLLLHNYANEKDANPLEFNKLLFGSGTNPDAKLASDSMTEEEARKTLDTLLTLQSATIVAAPLFGAVVSQKNPSWAEKMYDAIADPKVKASLASHYLLALAD